MDKLNSENVIDSIEKIYNNFFHFINRYILVLWVLFYVLLNIPVYKDLISYIGNAFFYFYIFLFFICGILSFIFINKLKPYFQSESLCLILFISSLVLMMTANDEYSYCNLIACVALPFIFWIIYEFSSFCWIIPIVCLTEELVFNNFITTFSLFFLCVFLYKYGPSLILKKSNCKIYTILTVFVFIFGLVKNYFIKDEFIAGLMNFQFYIDYFHFGFCTRGLMATIIYALFGNARSWYSLKIFLFFVHFIFILGILFVSYLIYKNVYKKTGYEYLLLLFSVFASGEIRFISSKDSIMYMDCILIFISVLCIYFLLIDRFKFLIPFLCVVAMCFHHIFGILCFPFLFICFFYKCLSYKKKNDWIILSITSFLVIGFFLYFQFFAYKFVPISLDDAMIYLQDSMGNQFSDTLRKTVNYVVYNGKVVGYGSMFSDFDVEDYLMLMGSFFYNALLFLPVLNILKIFFNASSVKLARLFSLAQFIPLISYMEIDYFRWDVAIAFFIPIEFMAFIFMNKENNNILLFNGKIKKWFIDYVFIVVILIISNI